MSKEYYYVTTPIYYVNAEPHIGHTYTTIVADVIKKYRQLKGEKAFFLTGTDEHGLKIAQSAQKAGKDVNVFCDEVAEKYKQAWNKLSFDYDNFIRTTDPEHEECVKIILQKLYDKGYIYKSKYEGLYCVGCEKYLGEDDLADGLCPDHRTKPETLEEENYFFKLSAFQDKLIELIEKDEIKIMPDIRKNEVLGKLRLGLEDISISRSHLKWGVNLPFDESQIAYVWIDALVNYLSGIGYNSDNELFNKVWPADIHLLAKDILWFHCIIWPAVLLAVDLPLPKSLFVHGFFTVNNQKISKTLGNIIDPVALSEEFGIDVVRYFMLREATFGLDYDFSEEAIKRRLNTDLANDLGNLLNRSVSMAGKYFEGRIVKKEDGELLDKEISLLAEEIKKEYITFMDELALRQALESVWKLVVRLNRYVEETAPWKLSKEGNTERLNTVMYNLIEGLRHISILIYPIMPHAAQNIWTQLGLKDNVKDQCINSLKWGQIEETIIVKGEPLFKKAE
ncbi:MAG: methionine--tRNA ligase [Armatimonadota bacterium]